MKTTACVEGSPNTSKKVDQTFMSPNFVKQGQVRRENSCLDNGCMPNISFLFIMPKKTGNNNQYARSIIESIREGGKMHMGKKTPDIGNHKAIYHLEMADMFYTSDQFRRLRKITGNDKQPPKCERGISMSRLSEMLTNMCFHSKIFDQMSTDTFNEMPLRDALEAIFFPQNWNRTQSGAAFRLAVEQHVTPKTDQSYFYQDCNFSPMSEALSRKTDHKREKEPCILSVPLDNKSKNDQSNYEELDNVSPKVFKVFSSFPIEIKGLNRKENHKDSTPQSPRSWFKSGESVTATTTSCTKVPKNLNMAIKDGSNIKRSNDKPVADSSKQIGCTPFQTASGYAAVPNQRGQDPSETESGRSTILGRSKIVHALEGAHRHYENPNQKGVVRQNEKEQKETRNDINTKSIPNEKFLVPDQKGLEMLHSGPNLHCDGHCNHHGSPRHSFIMSGPNHRASVAQHHHIHDGCRHASSALRGSHIDTDSVFGHHDANVMHRATHAQSPGIDVKQQGRHISCNRCQHGRCASHHECDESHEQVCTPGHHRNIDKSHVESHGHNHHGHCDSSHVGFCNRNSCGHCDQRHVAFHGPSRIGRCDTRHTELRTPRPSCRSHYETCSGKFHDLGHQGHHDTKEVTDDPLCRGPSIRQCQTGRMGCIEHHFHDTSHVEHRATDDTFARATGETERLPSVHCQYHKYGCEHKVKQWNHSDECSYRLVPCPDLKCHEYVPVKKLLNHISSKHPFSLWLGHLEDGYVAKQFWNINSQKNLVNSKSNTWVLTIWQYDGENFIAVLTRRDRIWYSWVYIVGHILMAQKYDYNITISNSERKGTCSYTGMVHPIEQLGDEVISSHNCFVATDVAIQEFLTKEGLTEAKQMEGYDYRLPIEYSVTRVLG